MADAICNVQTQQRLTWKCTKSPCRSTAGQQKHREAGHGPALLRGNEQRGHLRRQHTWPEAPDGPESSKETHGRAAHQQPSRSRHAITAGARVGGGHCKPSERFAAPVANSPRPTSGTDCSQARTLSKEPQVTACRHLGWRGTHSSNSGPGVTHFPAKGRTGTREALRPPRLCRLF